MVTQRLRITYRKVGALRYVAHLDLMRTWERALRRARLPLAYSKGFSPHPRLALAAPLPVGMVGEGELMDVWLDEPAQPSAVQQRLQAALPPGLEIAEVRDIGERLPSLQASTRFASYRVRLAAPDIAVDGLRRRVDKLLALAELRVEEERGDKTRSYDLRATIRTIEVETAGDEVVLRMDLDLTPERTGRPASVLAVLGVTAEPLEVARERIVIDEPQLAIQAWRERGRFEE